MIIDRTTKRSVWMEILAHFLLFEASLCGASFNMWMMSPGVSRGGWVGGAVTLTKELIGWIKMIFH